MGKWEAEEGECPFRLQIKNQKFITLRLSLLLNPKVNVEVEEKAMNESKKLTNSLVGLS